MKRVPNQWTETLLAKASDYIEAKAGLDRRKGEYTGYSPSWAFREDEDDLTGIALEFEDAMFAAVAEIMKGRQS